MSAGADTGAGAPASAPGALQADQVDAYRRNPYPSFVHPLTHPDRIATVARLCGFAAPDVRTARILEVGTGDGLNILNIAATLPEAECVAFDIEPEGVARGRERLAAAGLTNVRLEVADLVAGMPEVEGRFDYIIAHGVFAWVPEPVALALLRLFADRLSPDGIAFVSFNALPGSFATMAIRDAMLRAVGDATEPAERLDRARALLQAVAEPRRDDGELQKGLRAMARDRFNSDGRVMLHDELNAAWHPWHLSDVIDQARAHGLKFLSDCSYAQVLEGVLFDEPEAPDEVVQHFVETRASADDSLAMRSFRRVLLVRDEAAPTRRFDPAAVEALYASSYADEVEPERFAAGPRRIQCDHPPLRDALRRLIAVSPERVPVRDLGLDPPYLRALVELFNLEMLSLHTQPTRCATAVPERPSASPLARAMVAEGSDWAATLDHRIAALDPGAKEVLRLLDGTTDRETLYAELAGRGFDGPAAVDGLVRIALLAR